VTDPEIIARAGAKLRSIRLRLGLSLREVERRSLKTVADRENKDFYLSRATLTDVEMGKYIPRSFKFVTIGEIYGLTIAEIQKLYGIEPSAITKERPVFWPPKTQLLLGPGEDPGRLRSTDTKLVEKTDLITQLVDIWGDVPVPLLRHLELRPCLFGYIGASDRTMAPLLPPGTFVQIDPKQTRVQDSPMQTEVGQSEFARPIYFLDLRTGYACGWCQLKDGVLTLIPHPLSGEPTRTFRHPNEAEVVGLVVFIARSVAQFRPPAPPKPPSEPKK
jgi:transcriptional regulator with XRE-family HTH domain